MHQYNCFLDETLKIILLIDERGNRDDSLN